MKAILCIFSIVHQAYPDEETVFIGLFMVEQAYQREGLAVRL